MENLEQNINRASSLDELEKVRVEIFGKRGIFTAEFAKLKNIPSEKKKSFAQSLNKKKAELQKLFESKKLKLREIELQKRFLKDKMDLSIYNSIQNRGALHPVRVTMDKIIDYFISLNFSIEEGPMVEDEFHNFEAFESG